jgi:homocysteine S-methyltransferase
MQPFLDALALRPLVCDGAMGTVLYEQGVFLNRSFDALNVTEPARVSSLHRAYLRAGADVIETNTFGANRVKLRAFGLADRLRDINVAGVRLAREAASGSAFVAGAIGPLGLRIEPWGRTSRAQAEGHFLEQAEALLEGGVDLFVLETFRDLHEITAALAALRALCSLPIVAQMTVEDDGNSLDGTSPEQFTAALVHGGASVIGLNCSIGPAHMLETLERMGAISAVPLSAQPNAGRPRSIEGRTIYLTSPEYMASYTRRFLGARVRLVGGCCGTTPEHIAQIRAAVDRVAAGHRWDVSDPPPQRSAQSIGVEAPVTSLPRSQLSQAFAEGRWVRLVELAPPKVHETERALADARRLRHLGVTAVRVPDGSPGPRLSALSVAVLIVQRVGIDVLLEYSAREKPLLAMQSELFGAHAMGIRNVLAVTGDTPIVGDYPDATAITEVDSIGLVNAISRFNQGRDVGGQSIGSPAGFHLGVAVNPAAEDLDEEIRRFDQKVKAGARFVVARPVFDVGAFERFHRHIETSGLPILMGLRPLESALEAEYLANEAAGVYVPREIRERMRRAPQDGAAQVGVVIACEIARALRPLVNGVDVVAPAGRLDLVVGVLDGLD